MRSTLNQAHAYGAAHRLHSARTGFGEALRRVRSVTVPIKDVRFGQRSGQNLTGGSRPIISRAEPIFSNDLSAHLCPLWGTIFCEIGHRAKQSRAMA